MWVGGKKQQFAPRGGSGPPAGGQPGWSRQFIGGEESDLPESTLHELAQG